MSTEKLKAAILDLDGVITQTARVHARAWKRMFDAFLERRSNGADESYEPFSVDHDYTEYVDGKPRLDGVRSFLAARGIELAEGNSGDPAGADTIHGLGNWKNEIFHDLLREQGVEVYEETVEKIRYWRSLGMKTAVVSSSKNCVPVLEAAGLRELFDVKIDGVDSEQRQLKGKPEPDIFLEAARELGVEPSSTVAVEDAPAGVQAACAAGCGLVIGVARSGDVDRLRRRGADRVVRDLGELENVDLHQTRQVEHSTHRTPKSAREHSERIRQRLQQHRAVLFLDYDGTLTPIVRRPDQATLSDSMREVLRQLAERHTVAIVSGRDRADVERMVGLEQLYYAGSHGFDITGPGNTHRQQDDAQAALPSLEAAEQELRQQLQAVRGAWVERKRFAVAIHYREAADEDIEQVEQIVERVAHRHHELRQRQGKKIFELQPDVSWDKGHAVLWLLRTLGLDGAEVAPIYIGDDTTDEDAFEALHDRGIGIVVGHAVSCTRAHYYLHDTHEVEEFLWELVTNT